MVPPTSNSTGMPVLAVKLLATTFSSESFQFPPHALTTRAFCASAAGTAAREAKTIRTIRRFSMAYLLVWISEPAFSPNGRRRCPDDAEHFALAGEAGQAFPRAAMVRAASAIASTMKW